ncbi:hypothetical protein PLESTB_000030700 [Pleodorina starrii]|uniref:Uncharacterized protein n=1 Tax=Pleodorina starrii TaxID=330485 RepID=A0A9W6EWV2_9CHLO|nr:hypothetical protein PLESTM_001103600 [Pleodorina starrii]GLC47834.1 hypothetical protein PLESTB_000030700 [Pleodorina starrii]
MAAAQEDAVQPPSGTDGWLSSAPGSRSHHQSQASPARDRRPTNSTYKNGDGTDFPRYFLQLGQELKRSRGYEMIQELQLMVCSKETGIKGNAARARVMVLLREVQGVLIGLENKVDSQTYDLGVFNVERSELRKELRDQKAKEFQPLHAVDFRSTEVKDLPHKLRTLFEDNQILREQVRHLQYSVRSAETRLEASERRTAALETENHQLYMALREAGSSPDIAHDMRRMREVARAAEARAMHLEMQMMSVTEQLEGERRLAAQKARHSAAKHAMLESRLTAALSTSIPAAAPPPSGRPSTVAAGGGGGGRKSSARSCVYDPMGMDDAGSVNGGAVAISLYDGAGGYVAGAGGFVPGGGGGADGRSSAHSRTHTATSAGGAGRSSAGRERSTSPPRSPSGRSISHSPGSVIPTLYPLFNAKHKPPHAYSPDSSPWLSGTAPSPAASGGGAAGAGASSFSGSPPPPPPLPPPPPSLARNLSFTEQHRPVGLGGPMGRPSSGHVHQTAAALAAAEDARSVSSASTSTSSPGELVRALNSSAVVTSRPLLPSVSGASASGGGGGGGRISGAGTAAAAATAGGGGGAGILALRVGGGVGSLRRSTGSDDLPSPRRSIGGREVSGAATPRDGRASYEAEGAGRWMSQEVAAAAAQ